MFIVFPEMWVGGWVGGWVAGWVVGWVAGWVGVWVGEWVVGGSSDQRRENIGTADTEYIITL